MHGYEEMLELECLTTPPSLEFCAFTKPGQDRPFVTAPARSQRFLMCILQSQHPLFAHFNLNAVHFFSIFLPLSVLC